MTKTKLATALALFLAAGLAYAQAPPQTPPQAPPPASGPEKAMTKELAVQVVSTDAVAKTITVKKEGASTNTTLSVEAAAVDALKTVKSGDKVKLVCKTDSTGNETSVTDIKRDKAKENPPD